MDKFIGIDISKQTFDVAYRKEEKWKCFNLPNNTQGFRQLEKHLVKGDCIVMEASGPYYLQLATYLYTKGYRVVVENPLVIKRFSQMRLQRAKTDKKDAQTIAEYAQINELREWQPEADQVTELKQLQTAIEGIQKMLHRTMRQLEAFRSTGLLVKNLESEMKRVLNNLNRSLVRLEARQLEIAKKHYAKTIELLTSIPGIGDKTAMMLVVITNNFKKFDHYKKLIAYVGFSPRIYQSGTSVRGKGHICKMGKSQIRKLLYMCSWTAKRCNRSCREMYERLIGKGKAERVVKIAIANKLLKQAFAIAISGKKYTENYQTNTWI